MLVLWVPGGKLQLAVAVTAVTNVQISIIATFGRVKEPVTTSRQSAIVATFVKVVVVAVVAGLKAYSDETITTSR